MSDEQEAVNATPEQTEVTESAPVEEQAPQEEVAPQEASTVEEGGSEDKPELTNEEVGNLSEKAQKRFQKLANEKRELAEKVAKYEQENRINQLTQNQGGLPQASSHEDGTIEMPITELQQMVQQQIWIDNKKREIGNDVADIIREHPELDRAKDGYNETLDNLIFDGYQAAVKRNPNLRLRDYAEQVITIRDKGRKEGQAEVTAKTMAQMAESHIEGSQSADTRSLEERAKDMSMSELEKVVPRIDYGY